MDRLCESAAMAGLSSFTLVLASGTGQRKGRRAEHVRILMGALSPETAREALATIFAPIRWRISALSNRRPGLRAKPKYHLPRGSRKPTEPTTKLLT
jgi:hypothetical protein